MVLNEFGTVVFFKMLNFVLIAGLIIYGVFKYFLPDLIVHMKKAVEYVKGLRRSHRSLQKEAHALKDAMIEDQKEQARLKKYVQYWKAMIEEERNVLLSEREERKKILDAQFEKRKSSISLYRTYKQAVPESIERARKQLEEQFAHSSAQQKYVDRVMRDLRSK